VTQLRITVLPPFWKSKFAMVLYIVIIFLMIFSTKMVMVRIHKLQSVIDFEKQLTEYKVKFFTNISHEFRTPLFLIQGSMEALLESIKLPLSERKHFQVMQRNTNRLLMLIEQLLDFTKVQNKSMKLNLAETDVVDFLRDIFNSFADLAEKKQIHYNFSSNLNQSLLFIDQAIVDKIVYNLLSNAFKFTPENGKISLDITIEEQTKKLTIVVSDTGTGIPLEKQALIFTRFAQIQPTTTGIGLSLTREMAELHKGIIEFQSTPGVGTAFKVSLQTDPKQFNSEDFIIASQAIEHQRLPVIDDSEDEKQTLYKDIKSLNSTKILIIEDNDEIRNYLMDYFGKYFRVEEAANGAEGLEKASEDEPDLIICDILMPEMNGLQLTQKLKSDFQTSHIPIVLLTALASPDYQLQGTEAGADAYITKPFSIKYLLTKVIKLIEQRETLRQKYTSSSNQENVLICKNDKDKEFMDKAYRIAEENITNPDFSVDEFAKLVGFGRTVFFKKIKGITGHSPNEYMRVVRMKKAMELLQTGQFTVSEISYKVGITDPFYFSRCFKSQFGHSPSAYLKK
ncbi:MAG TPA: response regulator, partial [Bacteroidales bacterium]